MSGMFPDNQTIEIFGEQVQWPGVDGNGKFTNGSFTDPLIKPSFIPAETINLILNNLEEFIKKCNGNPNSTTASQLADLIASQPQANKIILRDAQGRAKVAEPVSADDIARKAEIDMHTNSTAAIHGATDVATANRLIIRDANGRAQVAVPAFDDDSLLIAPTKWVRENFNSRTISDYVFFSYIPTVAEMIKMRVVPLEGQVLPIVQYQDLFNKNWSPSFQESGDWWYRCTSNGTRDLEGNYFRVLDHQGLFPRAGGRNSKYKMANDAPFDGKEIGAYIEDAMQEINALVGMVAQDMQGYPPTPPFLASASIEMTISPGQGIGAKYTKMILSTAVRTAEENRPASISSYLCIRY
jgi:hypothetical protein